ncbi:MAG: sialate O-acetylesterase [Planctomycetes bacterium]|nr:sialate O-acetylesterase [Planctomycetota bacterium]
MKTRILLLALAVAVTPALARADVKPHALISEGMVLQQKSKAKIWGTGSTDEKVTVTFRGKDATGSADAQGRWVVEVATGNAGGPFEMMISGDKTKGFIQFKDVLVGEVWVCSGQSNMEWTVNSCDKTDKDYATEAAHNPMLRMFSVKKNPQTTPQTETAGKWTDADPKTVGGFSACGYFFGRHLQEKMKVPVGLINSSWGGTRIETWMSESALAPWEKAPANAKSGQPNGASQLYNGMIHPILNYQVKGAIWYQGESNAGQAFKYRSLHPAMIENWRADFKNPDLAFHFVQLAPFTAVAKTPGESTWAELREAQAMTLKLPNTGMAVITDLGSEYDIHPTPKRPVGDRLALAARYTTYHEKVDRVYSPMYKSVKFEGNKAIVSFLAEGLGKGGYVGKTLVPTLERKNKDGSTSAAWRVDPKAPASSNVTGFTICGKDKVFHPADAKIVDDTVVVSSEKVSEPIAVRYGWANHPICGLFNRDGLPASPFRTDDFPGITQPKTK